MKKTFNNFKNTFNFFQANRSIVARVEVDFGNQQIIYSFYGDDEPDHKHISKFNKDCNFPGAEYTVVYYE